MYPKSYARHLCIAAACIALCVVLPMVFHAFPNGGSIFLPMHIPVLLCGILCGWPYGFLCGFLGPALSSILTSMPSPAYLPPMMIECAAYGCVIGLMTRFVHTGHALRDQYLSLITAMLAGRIISGIAKALIFTPGLAFSAWILSSFVTALPGILVQLVLLPLLVQALTRAHLIPNRYIQEASL